MATEASLGNDIVDLRFKEPALHPRFISRVFTPLEKNEISDDLTMLWLHWSAKEAAYKTFKRLHSELIFSPVLFQVDTKKALVLYNDLALPLSQVVTSEYVYSVCTANIDRSEEHGVHHWIEEVSGLSPSQTIRELALRKISELTNVDVSQMEITKNSEAALVPQLKVRGLATSHLLSFSHHGRFVACACYLSGTTNTFVQTKGKISL